ncbi:unnamed protein product [Prunus armeniaca]|uniref:Uncharacterized protein n=1 Tax=Prunus armeniaca TaxID=36596 RepID=A0A6J5V435_PRUAR|nr:unnamed protein product [Prunus armeniaca]
MELPEWAEAARLVFTHGSLPRLTQVSSELADAAKEAIWLMLVSVTEIIVQAVRIIE